MGSAQMKPSKSSGFHDRDSPDIKTLPNNSADIKTLPNNSADIKQEQEQVVHCDTETDGGKPIQGFSTVEEAEIEREPVDGIVEQTQTAKKTNDDDDSDASQDDKNENKGESKHNAKLELTAEEMEAYKEDHVSKFRERIGEAHGLASYTQEDGKYQSEVQAAMMKMYRLYFQLNKVKGTPLAELIVWRKRIAAIAMETKLLDLMCEVVMTTYPDRLLTEDGKLNYLFKFTLLTLSNYADASTDFAVAVATYPGFCETIKQMLEDQLEGHVSKSQTASMDKITQWSLSIVHNLTMAESNIGRLREVDFLLILTAYLATPKEGNRLNVFASLAGIINEKESEIIKANMDLVKFLLKVLSKGMATRLHRYSGWSCKECTLTVRMLARNDANKKLLVELGALELLVKLGQIGNQEEQYEAVSALWALSFDVDNRKRIVSEADLGVVDLLLELKASEEKRVGKVCEGALWTLRDDLKTSGIEKYRSIAPVESSASSSVAGGLQGKEAGHVMISYQWADQQMLMKIRDQLKAAGVKVWMDIDQMGGSTLESMAKAVEQSRIVLMCMSQKYKNSPNCRAEAEYAYQKQKAIVPLKMERGYMPDGWLGFICGAKLFFEFSPKYKFEDKMEALLKEIATIYERGGKRDDAVIVPKQAPTVTMATPSTHPDQIDSRPPAAVGSSVTMVTAADPHVSRSLKVIRGWEAADVQKWVEKNDLKSCGVDRLTGGEVAMLCMMYHRAPESFFKFLQETLKLKDLLKTSKIVWALNDLVEGQ